MSAGLVMPKATFGKDRRLLNAYDFKQVFDNNSVRVAHPKLLILAKPNSLSTARLGLVIAKKNVPTSVARNRLKRVVRESFRITTIPVPVDIVFLARKDAHKLSPEEMSTLLQQSWHKLALRLEQEPKANA